VLSVKPSVCGGIHIPCLPQLHSRFLHMGRVLLGVQVQEQKGLDIVRRDWCPLSKDVGNFALAQILSGRPAEDVVLAIHNQLMEVRVTLAGSKRRVACWSAIAFEWCPGNLDMCLRLLCLHAVHLHRANYSTCDRRAVCSSDAAIRYGLNVLRASQVKEKVAAGQVPMAKYIITKQLTKRPEDYPDAKNQPHVQVALRRKAGGARNGVMQVCRKESH